MCVLRVQKIREVLKMRMGEMKFAVSYSCGKDSTLALHKMMIEEGHKPVCLVVMVNEEVGRSYFHGADKHMLEQYAESLDLPMIQCSANGQNYHLAFEAGLAKAKAMGAEAVCFGDIDIEQNRQWEENRCATVGLIPVFPLWHCGREENVHELVAKGYQCLIKSINRTVLPMELLGRTLDDDSIAIMRSAGIDICGENGEYHTLVTDGPAFKRPLRFQIGDMIEMGDYAVVDIR